MKKWLAIVTLAAMLLAMTGSALAEDASEKPIEADELLGVWQSEEDDDLILYILPGSYAPKANASKLPELFAEGRWREAEERCLSYMMDVNQRKQEGNSFLDSLLGVSMSNALQTINNIGGGAKNDNILDCFDYSNATIGILWSYGEDEEDFVTYTDKAEGSFFALRGEDGKVVLFWVDDYDPHIAGIEMRRLSVETPSAEALTGAVLRPVIDMAGGAEVQTALALARWASENRCMRMDGAALADNLRAAYAALSPADAQAFKDNYAQFATAMLDALGLNPKTWNDPERAKPFKDAGLGDAIQVLTEDPESQRSVDVLNSAIEGIIEIGE